MKIAIFGASGLAREVADICLDLEYGDVILIDYEAKQTVTFGFPVVDEREIPNLETDGFVFSVGIGEPRLRRQVFAKFPRLLYVNLIHPAATFGCNERELVESGRGNIVAAGARLTNNIRTGNFNYFHVNCTIGHDCITEDFVNVGPGANISGNVRLEEGAYVGAGATVLQGDAIDQKLVVGSYAVVGAGAVVTKRVLAGATVVGIPARVVSS